MDNGLIFPYRLVTVQDLTSSAKQTKASWILRVMWGGGCEPELGW